MMKLLFKMLILHSFDTITMVELFPFFIWANTSAPSPPPSFIPSFNTDILTHHWSSYKTNGNLADCWNYWWLSLLTASWPKGEPLPPTITPPAPFLTSAAPLGLLLNHSTAASLPFNCLLCHLKKKKICIYIYVNPYPHNKTYICVCL